MHSKDEHRLTEAKEKDRLRHVADEKSFIERQFTHDHLWEDLSDHDQDYDRKRFSTKHE